MPDRLPIRPEHGITTLSQVFGRLIALRGMKYWLGEGLLLAAEAQSSAARFTANYGRAAARTVKQGNARRAERNRHARKIIIMRAQ